MENKILWPELEFNAKKTRFNNVVWNWSYQNSVLSTFSGDISCEEWMGKKNTQEWLCSYIFFKCLLMGLSNIQEGLLIGMFESRLRPSFDIFVKSYLLDIIGWNNRKIMVIWLHIKIKNIKQFDKSSSSMRITKGKLRKYSLYLFSKTIGVSIAEVMWHKMNMIQGVKKNVFGEITFMVLL